MDKYVCINDNLFKLSIIHLLKNGKYLICFWVNEGSENQDLVTAVVDVAFKSKMEGKETFTVTNAQPLAPKSLPRQTGLMEYIQAGRE